MDTAAVLQVRAALDLSTSSSSGWSPRSQNWPNATRSTPMAGRTHGQHAVPITFGLSLAVWLDELGRARAPPFRVP